MPNKDMGGFDTDILRISGDLIPEIGPKLDKLLEKGRAKRVQILEGSESPTRKRQTPYATTTVSITFDNEDDLRQCVRLLRWSDERLRKRPDQLILWDWSKTFREDMTITFGVNWYDQAFFESRKETFRNPQHRDYYSMFGANPESFRIEHVIAGKARGAKKRNRPGGLTHE